MSRPKIFESRDMEGLLRNESPANHLYHLIMIKKTRKIIKLFVPSVLMHHWLRRRYKLEIPIPGATKFRRFLIGLSPYFVSAILQQRKPTDRRVFKYFLPYGKMREYVKARYDMNVGDAVRGGGAWSLIRSFLPYGLILWWDAEEVRLANKSAAPRPAAPRPTASGVSLAEFNSLKAQVEAFHRESNIRADTSEIISLRMALGGVRPSVTLVITGCGEVDDVRRALNEQRLNSIYELEIIVATTANDAEIGEALAEFVEADARIKILDSTGKTLVEVRSEALAVATGDYVAFLNVNDRYANRQSLELLVLTAAAEGARICCGKFWLKIDGKVSYLDEIMWNRRGFVTSSRSPIAVGLLSTVFERAWLVETGLRPLSYTGSNDMLFVKAAEVLAGRVFCVGRTVGVAGRDTTAESYTTAEKPIGVLWSLVDLARFATNINSAPLRKFLSDEIQKKPWRRLCALAWGDDAKAIRPVFDELMSLLPECGIQEYILMPLVSVVVPAYNVEPYLGRTLESLLNQTLRSIEIIVVDDGSTDGTAEICDRYAAQYTCIRVLHRENGGLSAARNSGLAIARGKYVGFVDGDDFVDATMFEKMSDMLEDDPGASFAMCGVQVEFTYEVSDNDRMWAQRYFDFTQRGAVEITASSAYDINCIVCNKLYLRDFLRNNGICFPEGYKNEDAVFSFFVMGKASRLVATGERFYHYIRNKNGIMAKQNEDFVNSQELPDALTKSMPLIAEYLLRDDRRDLLGAFFHRLCGAANGFRSEAAARCVAQTLHKVGYFYNREFLDNRDLGWVKNQLSYYQNYDCSDSRPISVDVQLLPKLRTKHSQIDQPLMSVIIPVFNQEQYLTYCLESVRKQTLADIEIICIDDGSIDHSLSLLKELSACDGRIRVFHRENSGAGATRNFGMKQARGKYIVFVDADDWVERDYLDTVSRQMEQDDLDMCLIDLVCFDYNTRKSLDHYWSLKRQIGFYPRQRVFCFDDLKQFRCMMGPATAVWRREFLTEKQIEFPLIKNGEDTIFWMRAMPFARRIGLTPYVFYHYRRGNPTSAVSRLHSDAGRSNALVTICNLLDQWELMRPALSPRSRSLMAGRLSLEVSYHCKVSKDVLEFMQSEGFRRFGLQFVLDIAKIAPNWAEYEALMKVPPVDDSSRMAYKYREGFSQKALEVITNIEKERKNSKKDLYLITGQLNTTANAPIDSWLFFKWLQKQGIPSRYVMWKDHEWYSRLKKSRDLKDVIVLNGNGVDDYEFLFKCRDVLPRCKLFAQENGALNWRIRKWFYYLPDCPYVYLEHGIKYLKHSDHLGRFLSSFNAINNTSAFERNLIEANLPGYVDNGIKPVCFVGGLPRLETLKDLRDPKRVEFSVFVMFTWRETFNAGQEVLMKSAYFKGLQTLFSAENQERLAKARVRLVVAAHHHLVRHIHNLNLGRAIQIVPQEQIAYWKGHADCCLTDYSSISFDYAFLDKPVVFWCPDREDPILTPNDYNEQLVAESRESELTNVCRTAADVVSLLEEYAQRRFVLEKEKKEVMQKFFAHRTNICMHLYAALEKLTAQRFDSEA